MSNCKKCNTPMVKMYGDLVLTADDELYESGKEEEKDLEILE